MRNVYIIKVFLGVVVVVVGGGNLLYPLRQTRFV
jgi:hypothetical protein